MSDPWEDIEQSSRRRALLALAGLAAVAVLFVGLMVAFLNSSAGTPRSNQPVLFSQTALPRPASVPPAAPASTTSAAPAASSSAPAGPPCPDKACIVPGDAGNAVAAVNAFRTGHSLPAVPGAVTVQAGQCALDRGDGSACFPHYAWQSLPAQDGAKAVAALADRQPQWLLDPDMTSFSVGWAYSPAEQQWYWAALKVG